MSFLFIPSPKILGHSSLHFLPFFFFFFEAGLYFIVSRSKKICFHLKKNAQLLLRSFGCLASSLLSATTLNQPQPPLGSMGETAWTLNPLVARPTSESLNTQSGGTLCGNLQPKYRTLSPNSPILLQIPFDEG